MIDFATLFFLVVIGLVSRYLLGLRRRAANSPRFWAGFGGSVVRCAERLGLKKSRLILFVSSILATVLFLCGIDPKWCFAVMVVPYAMERVFPIINRLVENRELRRDLTHEQEKFGSDIGGLSSPT